MKNGIRYKKDKYWEFGSFDAKGNPVRTLNNWELSSNPTVQEFLSKLNPSELALAKLTLDAEFKPVTDFDGNEKFMNLRNDKDSGFTTFDIGVNVKKLVPLLEQHGIYTPEAAFIYTKDKIYVPHFDVAGVEKLHGQ